MIAQIEKQYYTPSEYLDREIHSQERHEYVNGEIRVMTGGPPNHNDIASNLLVALKLVLKGQPYRTLPPISASGFLPPTCIPILMSWS